MALQVGTYHSVYILLGESNTGPRLFLLVCFNDVGPYLCLC